MSVLTLDASPVNMLRAIRGPIIRASLAYPDVLHLEVRDATGGIWRLATQDAEFFPADPGALLGKSIEDAETDAATGELCLKLSGAEILRVTPGRLEASDDPPNWELITPEGLALEFGPGLRWQISSADVSASPNT